MVVLFERQKVVILVGVGFEKLDLLREKQPALNSLPVLPREQQVVLFERHCLPFFMNKHLIIFETNWFPFNNGQRLPLLRRQQPVPLMLFLLWDKQVALFEGQLGCPFQETNRLSLLRDKQVAPFEADMTSSITLFEGQKGCPF